MKPLVFAEKYGVKKDGIYVRICNGQVPPEAWDSVNGEIDEKFYIRRLDFRTYVINFNHSMYYYLSEYFSDLEIARNFKPDNVTSASTWFTKGMWMQNDNTIFDYKVRGYHWDFFRFGRRVKRKIERTIGHKIDIEYLLDRMMEKSA